MFWVFVAAAATVVVVVVVVVVFGVFLHSELPSEPGHCRCLSP